MSQGFDTSTSAKTISHLPQDGRRLVEDVAFDFMAGQLEAAGLKIEDHLRVSDAGFAISKDAIALIAQTGYPNIDQFGDGQPNMDGIGIGRSPFVHPLSVIDSASERLNIWGLVSILISAAQGWVSDPQYSDIAAQDLRKMVAAANPTVDFDLLMRRAKYDDRALLKLANLAKTGLEAIDGIL